MLGWLAGGMSRDAPSMHTRLARAPGELQEAGEASGTNDPERSGAGPRQ